MGKVPLHRKFFPGNDNFEMDNFMSRAYVDLSSDLRFQFGVKDD